jgi:hypothetical protein
MSWLLSSSVKVRLIRRDMEVEPGMESLGGDEKEIKLGR